VDGVIANAELKLCGGLDLHQESSAYETDELLFSTHAEPGREIASRSADYKAAALG